MSEHYDVMIVGAGLSGIGAACHLSRECPNKSFAILEARERLGGTWDLFRYPGIRSDSDMHTLGYNFKPWTDPKAIADGPSILKYIHETAQEFGVRDKVQLNARLAAADWETATQSWRLTIAAPDGTTRVASANFLMMCSGYYKYAKGHTPHFEGQETFKGPIIHPQHWPEDLDYAGKKIVVIGSGATAVTLIPKLAETASHVTMLQRSPTYVAMRGDTDHVANILRKLLPEKLAYKISRWKNIAYNRYIYSQSRKNPQRIKDFLAKQIRKELGKDYPVDVHFNPSYDPWDQRLCLDPNGLLFAAIRAGNADVVTDHIAAFDEAGITLKSGAHLDADIIVTATGLDVVALGEANISIDGQTRPARETFGYKGLMFSGVPNMVSVFGYTNASWTLRADLISEYACRLINHMDAKGYASVTPRAPDDLAPLPWIDFDAGYLARVEDQLPKSSDRHPWMNKQDYKFDIQSLRKDPLEDGVLEFRAKTTLQEAAE